MRALRRALLVQLIAFALVGALGELGAPTDSFSFAVLSDLHIGLGEDQTVLLQQAIATINGLINTSNIQFVVVTGDITNNAKPEQFVLAKELLATLKVPVLPCIGNHDIWTYDRPTSWTSPEEPYPTGDAKFRDTFEDWFAALNITHNFNTYNTTPGHNATFINWQLSIPSSRPDGKTFVLMGLDFVTRNPAINPRDFDKGVGPTADLHNIPNGTYDWLRRQLANLDRNQVGHLLFTHHHPYSATPYWVPDYFSMNVEDRKSMKALIANAPLDISQFAGAVVGHMHYWDDSMSMFPTFRQWETTATMNEGSNSISIVSVKDGLVTNMERCCGWWTKSNQVVIRFSFTAVCALLQVITIFVIAKYVKREGKHEKKIRNANFPPDYPSFLDNSTNNLLEDSPSLISDQDAPGSLSGGLSSIADSEPELTGTAKAWHWLSHDFGFTWFIAFAAIFCALAICVAGPQFYSETYQAITVGLMNDAALMPFALLFAFGLGFPFGSYFAHYFGYIVYLCIWSISFIVDFVRYDIRTYWTNTQDTYIEYYGAIIFSSIFVAVSVLYLIFLRRGDFEKPIGVKTHFNMKYFLRFLSLLLLPGLSLQIFLSMGAATSHRLLFPIDWPEWNAFYYLRLIVCGGMIIVFPVTCYAALRNIHPLFVVCGSYAFFSVLNVVQELLLREPTFPFNTALNVLWWIGATLEFIAVGVVAWANFKLKVREAKAKVEKRRVNDY